VIVRKCDYCKKEVGFFIKVTIDKSGIFKKRRTGIIDIKGIYAGGEDEICLECFKKLSKAILEIKK